MTLEKRLRQPIPAGKITKPLPEFAGISPSPLFEGVPDPTGGSSRTVVKNTNRRGVGDGHETMTTGRTLPKGTTTYCAFDWLYLELAQTGRNLIFQTQMVGSPTDAISTEAGRYVFVTRDGTVMRRQDLGAIPWGKWVYFVVGTTLADKPDGMACVWVAVGDWPDVAKPALIRRTGQQTWQGATAHNTIGQYSAHSKDGDYVGYFSRFGRAATPAKAIELAA